MDRSIKVETLPGEKWRLVPGFHTYRISNFGRLLKKDGQLAKLKPAGRDKNYLCFNFCRKGFTQNIRIHRTVLAAFVGVCPAGAEVNHKNGIGSDNRIENLEYATKSENMKHSWTLGRRNNRKFKPRKTDAK